MKKIIAVLTAFSLVFSGLLINIAADSVYDPFGTAALGPSAPETESDYSALGKAKKFEKKSDRLEISAACSFYTYPLTLAFPKTGGVRLFGKTAGDFATEDFYTLEYTDIQADSFAVRAVGGDGAYAVFTNGTDYFTLDYYNAAGTKVTAFKSSGVQVGTDSRNDYNAVKLSLPIEETDVIYGTGERFSGLNQNGRRTIMWNVDCGYHGENAVNAELWRGYKNVPLLYNNAGYTFYYDSYYSAKVDIGYTDPDVCSFVFDGPVLDFYIWTGTPLENIDGYTKLTGRSIVLPKWAYRYLAGAGSNYWFSRGRSIDNVSGLLQEVMNKFSELGTPDIAAMYLEGATDEREFNAETQKCLYDILGKTGTRVLQWNRPDLERERQKALLPGVAAADLPILKNTDGTDSGRFIDFTNSNSSQLMSEWLKPYLNLGLKGGILDFGELIQTNTVFSDGTTGYKGHNKFSVMYAECYYNALSGAAGSDFATFARAAAAGTQKYTAFFSGDQAANFRGLRQQLSAGLSAGASGFAMWGGDLAGYEGKPTNEVYCRGVQLSAFSPIMRAHGTTTRFPWNFGTEGEKVYKKYYWLRENLLDSIYSSAINTGKTGAPMMQALAMAFPDEKSIAAADDTYMFCDEILVSPVLTSSTVKNVTFPAGRWYDLYSGAAVSGGSTQSVSAPLDTVPAYLKSGAILPVTLSSSLKLCDPIERGSAVKALIVTPPETERTKTFYADDENAVLYTSKPEKYGYTISAGEGNGAATVLAYGTDPVTVTVDGKELKKIAADSDGAGFYVTADNITVIKTDTQGWNNISVHENVVCEYSRIWDFSSADQLTDFDAYMNDKVYGYEKQSADYRWVYNESNSTLRQNAWMCKESDKENGRWGGSLPDSAAALTPKNIDLHNFETTVKFKLNNDDGKLGTVAVGFRETVPGQHSASLGSWDSLGRQNGGAVSALACAAGGNTAWLFSGGAKLCDTAVGGAAFGKDYYTLRVHVVEKVCKMFIYNSANELLFSKTLNLPDTVAESGAISYYATNDCLLKEVTVTPLDEDGQPFDYFGLYVKKWDLSDKNSLSQFDAYMNDSAYGYERQTVSFRWNTTDSGVTAEPNMASEKNPDSSRYGAVICGSDSALTPKGVDLRNFETTVRFKVVNPNGLWGAVSVGFRETWAGKHTDLANGENWNFGKQGKGLNSGFVSAVSKNELWVHASGVERLKATNISADFTGGTYVMRVKAVENICTVSLYENDGATLIYKNSLTLPDNIAERGAVSYYATNECLISEITLTALDSDGNITDMPYYADGDADRDGRTAAADIALIKKALLCNTVKYGHDVNKDAAFDIRDLIKLKKICGY